MIERRRMRYAARAAFALMLSTTCATPVLAHHSFAMFDRSKEVTLVGTIKDFQWTNPHCWIQMLVSANGQDQEWSLEGGSPGILSRNGWKRTSLKQGDKVTIIIYPLVSGQPGGSFIQVTTSDGQTFYYHG